MSVITRFPPSPTGYLHVGRARTALFNYLFAKKAGGTMVFRIEDTDKERSKPEYEANIIESLAWLGITYDSGPFRQSERTELYKTYIQKLLDGGFAYVSKEDEREETGNNKQDSKEISRRAEVIRFKNPNKKITFIDLIRGDITFDTTDLGDFVIARSVDEPLYHLTVVVDDHEMKVTHIIRGEDGISNTPRQILIQEGIGATRPLYAHVPLILAPDKSKLSGRHGAVAVTEYRDKGYLPEAVLNFLALLGWNPGTEQEIFSLQDLIPAFDISKINKSGAVFNIEKLNWFNKEYIKKLSDEDFATHAKSFLPDWIKPETTVFKRLIPLLRDKITTFSDIPLLFGADSGGTIADELSFVRSLPDYPRDLLLWKKNPDPVASQTHLAQVRGLLAALSDETFTPDSIKTALWSYAEEKGKGDVLWPLRVAVTGKEKSPDPFVSASAIGKTETLSRIEQAIAKLS
ncbi:MAG: glutamate--tRNA ligase [Patescibacteria group bacterium]